METHKLDVLPYKMIRINGDTITPISIFKNLTGDKKFLLESSFEHEKKGKYSYIGTDPYKELIGDNKQTIVKDLINHTEHTHTQHALQYMRDHFPKVDIDLPLPFTGGAIGYIGYDAIRSFVHIGSDLEDTLHMPDVHLMFYQNIIIYEHMSETAYLLAMNVDDTSEEQLDRRLENMKYMLRPQADVTTIETPPLQFKSDMSAEAFKDKVRKAKAHIHAGDTEQIVISKRMKANIDGDPLSYYRRLRIANPSPYMFYVDFADYLIIGASPESLVQTTGDHVVTNPIAGTRARGKSDAEDQALIKELLADEKELSEHDMLVELSKKDLSTICEPASINVPTYKKVEMYEHVMHIVSEVHGRLKKGLTSMDALIACLPAGTVSGAPKLRAMQIINELEPCKRGFYAGGIGYIGFNHDLNMALAIRSLIIKDHVAYLQTGAGIVADSDPDAEFAETLHKARSLMEVK